MSKTLTSIVLLPEMLRAQTSRPAAGSPYLTSLFGRLHPDCRLGRIATCGLVTHALLDEPSWITGSNIKTLNVENPNGPPVTLEEASGSIQSVRSPFGCKSVPARSVHLNAYDHLAATYETWLTLPDEKWFVVTMLMRQTSHSTKQPSYLVCTVNGQESRQGGGDTEYILKIHEHIGIKEWYYVCCATKVKQDGGTYLKTKVYPSNMSGRDYAVDYDIIMPTVYVVDDVKKILPYVEFDIATSYAE